MRWWSYAECHGAAKSLAADLPQSGAVVICAENGPGWLVADFACCLRGVPSICVDASTLPADAWKTANDAADARGVLVSCAVVDDAVADEWRLLPGGGGGGGGGGVVVFSVSDARARLVTLGEDHLGRSHDAAADQDASDDVKEQKDLEEAESLVTCLCSFGSAGASKPLWFDDQRWAEWGERNPPVSRKGRTALTRRSARVSCAALFAPLSHGLARASHDAPASRDTTEVGLPSSKLGSPGGNTITSLFDRGSREWL